jgi:hypothetical protein
MPARASASLLQLDGQRVATSRISSRACLLGSVSASWLMDTSRRLASPKSFTADHAKAARRLGSSKPAEGCVAGVGW